jgi:hypothetical protein
MNLMVDGLQAHPMTRDDCLNSKDVANISQTIDGLDWKYDPDQARSLHAFAAAVPEHVLHYQPQDSTTDQPFQMVFSKPSMLKLLVEHGHGRPLLMDSTFGTNNLKVDFFRCPLLTWHVRIHAFLQQASFVLYMYSSSQWTWKGAEWVLWVERRHVLCIIAREGKGGGVKRRPFQISKDLCSTATQVFQQYHHMSSSCTVPCSSRCTPWPSSMQGRRSFLLSG